MSALTATIKTRVDEEQRELLEREAERRGIAPATLFRIYLRDGLDRDRQARDHSRRV